MYDSGFSYNDLNYGKDLIQPYEYLLVLPFLMFIYTFLYIIRFKYYRNSPFKKYFIPGATVKIIGGLGVCLIYNYYYGSGDTCVYFNEGRLLTKIFLSNPMVGIRLFFSIGGNIAPDLYPYIQSFNFVQVENSFLIVKLTAFIQLFTFQSFLITSMMFGFLSFWGVWKLFRLFVSFYPQLMKPFAFAFLFVPSVFFWGSGILKDTICLTSLCFLFYCIHKVFIESKSKFGNIVGIVITSYLLVVIKIYIIMAFILCITIAVFLNYRERIKSNLLRNFITPIFVFVSATLGFFILKILVANSEAGLYSLDNILATAEATRSYIYNSGGGSGYTLGDIDNSVWGLLKVMPAGINVTLFRPYPWESHNIVAILSSLENLILLIITIRILYKVRPINFLKITISNYIAFFCITFSLIFAFAIGVSTYNFGTLVRYKIPCIPFYLTGILLVSHLASKKKEKKKRALAYQTLSSPQ